MRSLDSPCSASRTILARTTSQYGDVYFRTMDCSFSRSSPERLTLNGLFLGMRQLASDAQLNTLGQQIVHKYVIVLENRSTKPLTSQGRTCCPSVHGSRHLARGQKSAAGRGNSRPT